MDDQQPFEKQTGCRTGGHRRYVELGGRYIAIHAIRFMVNGSRQFMQEMRS